MVKVEKGWVEQEFELFDHSSVAKWKRVAKWVNILQDAYGKAHFKNVNNYLNTNIYSYLETSGSQSSNPYLNVVHFFNTIVN
jgi:hypothetical protein